jgi:AcrR family transcriptional regulator
MMAASLKRTLPDADQESAAQLPRGRHGLSRQFVFENQRERIIKGMIQTVGEKGYAETTVADVIKLAELSRKTFYDHFKSKEDCFLAAYDVIVKRITSVALDAYEKAESWTDGLSDALRATLRLLSAEPDVARLALVEILAAGPQALERYDRAMRQFVPMLEAGRGESVHGEEIPARVSEEIIGGVTQTLYLRVLEGKNSTLEDSFEDLLYFGLVPFVGHEQALRVAFSPASKDSEPSEEG